MKPEEKAAREQKLKVHAAIFEAVRSVIHQWDPYGLLALGCPSDEFDSEIHAVVGQVDRIHSSQDAMHVLSRVFSAAFEPEKFQPEKCQEAGEQLYRVLQEHNLLNT